jgi:hypothetical protein
MRIAAIELVDIVEIENVWVIRNDGCEVAARI